jgi:hypothetical protein
MTPSEFPGRAANAAASAERDAVVQALIGLNCESNLEVVRRTRYAIRDAALALREQRRRLRRNIGFTLLVFSILLILLAPAVWDSAEDLLSGEYLDFSSQVALLLLMIAPAMLAALAAIWKEQRSARREESKY